MNTPSKANSKERERGDTCLKLIQILELDERQSSLLCNHLNNVSEKQSNEKISLSLNSTKK